jgi:hypothetical protein
METYAALQAVVWRAAFEKSAQIYASQTRGFFLAI